MIKRMILMLVGLALVFGLIFGWRLYMNARIAESMRGQERPPVAVAATEAQYLSWQPSLSAVGSLQAAQGVEITVSVPGLVTDIFFTSGQFVKIDEPIISQDSRAERAQLERLEARLELARLQLNRQEELVGKKLAPQSGLDQTRAEFGEIRAQVRSQEVLIDKMKIKAPFEGILGIRKVDVGQYLSPGMPIVTLQDIDPVFVDFTLPQQHFGNIENGMAVKITVDSYPDKVFEGIISAINPKVETRTRNFRLRATLANEDLLLRPGMFGQVEIRIGKPVERITLPQTALSYNPYGDVIFVLEPETDGQGDQPVYTAHRRFVVTGETRGDQVAIDKGIDKGEIVATAGTHKLDQGVRAVIDNDVQPTDEAAPDLENQ